MSSLLQGWFIDGGICPRSHSQEAEELILLLDILIGVFHSLNTEQNILLFPRKEEKEDWLKYISKISEVRSQDQDSLSGSRQEVWGLAPVECRT